MRSAIRRICSWRVLVTGCAIALMVGGAAYIFIPKLSAAQTRQEGARQNPTLVAQARKQAGTYEPSFVLQHPIAITLPRLGIALEVLPGYYQAASRSWTLDRRHVFMMQANEAMSQPATPIIYGHNIPAVFTALNGVAPDEVLHITTKTGDTLLFRYVGDRVVNPEDDAIMHEKIERSILLMTCTGAQFQHRRLLQFEYIGSEKVTLSQRNDRGLFA